MKKPRNRKQIYEGKAKILFEGPEPNTLIQYFKDDTTAFNNQKHAVISGKGVLNNRISEFMMTRLAEMGIPNHFIRTLNMREQLVKKVDIIPVEVIIRNIAAGSLCKRLGIKEGERLPQPLVEYCYKNDTLGDPLVSEDHILTFRWADPVELEDMRTMALRVNDILCGLFTGIGIQLVDFKIEFGRYFPQGQEEGFGQLMLADEISPDSCRLWDVKTGKILDKDRFRKDLGNLAEAYSEVATRLGILIEQIVGEDELQEKRNGGAKKTSAYGKEGNDNEAASVK